jgi:serine/threonine protein kinase
MVGDVLEGKYRIEKKIGAGGFANVYKGFDLNLERDVAIKVLQNPGDNDSFAVRFRRELQSQARLSHPNIVTLYDVGQHEGQPYAVMELVDGYSLYELISETNLPPVEICQLALQVCRAMAYAHDQGIIHRDLKLNNIMVSMAEDESPQAKVVDFGLAKLMYAEMQTTGKDIIGTPMFMAPEQVRGEQVDARTDIFAFGVCLFRLLNGRFPFESEHPTAVMYMIVNETELHFEPSVPEELRDIVMRCLEKDPRNRPRNFTELAEEIENLQDACPEESTAHDLTSTFAAPLADRSSKRNPYLNRVMIKNPADFFGREREIRKIYSRLDAPHPQSISIVGDRRIGKSSLLNHIYHRSQRRAHMENYHSAIFVYMDFQGRADFNVPKFIDFLFNVFSYDTNTGIESTDSEKTLDQLRETVQELHEQGRRVIVLMDEFESITRNPNFDEGFFSFLRAMANSYRVAYVTSSCDELQHMCHNKDISDSPFFNIFSNLPLRPFTPAAARELITAPSATEGVPLEPYADELLEMAGLFPLYLQIACSCLFENLLEAGEGDPDWSRVTRMFYDEALPHFEFVWERMDDTERENLLRFAEGRKISRKYEFVNENLLRRGYLREREGGRRLFSESFRKFILMQTRDRAAKKSFFTSLFRRGGRD